MVDVTAAPTLVDRTPSETDVEDSASQLVAASHHDVNSGSSLVVKLVEKRMRALNKKISRIGTRYAAADYGKLNDSQKRSLLSLPALRVEYKELEDAKKSIEAREIVASRDQVSDLQCAKVSSKVQETVSNLEKIIQELRGTSKHEDSLNEIIESLRSGLSNETGAKPEKTLQELRVQLADYQSTTKQKEDSLNNIIKSLCADLVLHCSSPSPSEKLPNIEKTIQELRVQLADFKRNFNDSVQQLPVKFAYSPQRAMSLAKILRVYRKKHECESLYAEGNVIDAAQLLLDIARSTDDAVKSDVIVTDWVYDFTNKCIASLESLEE